MLNHFWQRAMAWLQNEIKKMITTCMLKRQVWMADDDEFVHIVKNSQRVLRLNDQYEIHPYVEEFTKGCNVMLVYGTYVLEVEVDAKLSLGDISNLFQEYLTKKRKQFLQANDKLYEDVELVTKNIRSSTEHRDYQASTWVNDGE